jgi:hypothetical protein
MPASLLRRTNPLAAVCRLKLSRLILRISLNLREGGKFMRDAKCRNYSSISPARIARRSTRFHRSCSLALVASSVGPAASPFMSGRVLIPLRAGKQHNPSLIILARQEPNAMPTVRSWQYCNFLLRRTYNETIFNRVSRAGHTRICRRR